MADSPADDKMSTSAADRRKPGRPKAGKVEASAPQAEVVVPFLDAAPAEEAPVLPPVAPVVEAPKTEVAAVAINVPDFKADAEIEAAPIQAKAEEPAPEPAPAAPAPVEVLPPSSNTIADVPAAPKPKGTYFMATIAPDMTKPATERFQAVFGDVNERAKTAFEKSTKLAEEMGELTKGNVEALVASGRVAAKGAEALTQEAAEYSKKSFESAATAMRSLAAAKSPVELIQLQNDFAKTSFDAAIAEASKLSETWVKLATDMYQPLSSRFAVAAEKMKAASL
jgi:phasin family protein